MKIFERILGVIRNLPEEARKLLAGFFLLIAAVLLFNNWATSVSSDLTLEKISAAEQKTTLEKTAGAKKEMGPESAPTAPAPFESIADSVKSLEKLIKNTSADSADSSEPLNQKVKDKISDSLAGLYAVSGKIWSYIYGPLR